MDFILEELGKQQEGKDLRNTPLEMHENHQKRNRFH